MRRKPKTVITVAQWGDAPLLIYLPLYVAMYGGGMSRYNLSVTLKFGGTDDHVYQLVDSGEADFGISDPIFTEMARKDGSARPYCSALVVQRVPIWGVTHNPAIGDLKRVEDFVHLRFGSLPRRSTTYSLIAGLKFKHKRLLKYMNVVEAPMARQLALLKTGKADVVLQIEPHLSLAEHDGLRVVFSLAQFYGKFAFTGLTVSPRGKGDDPTIRERVLAALAEGVTICHTETAKALDIAMHVFPTVSSEILEKAIYRLCAGNIWPKTIAVDETAWKAARALRRAIGDLP